MLERTLYTFFGSAMLQAVGCALGCFMKNQKSVFAGWQSIDLLTESFFRNEKSPNNGNFIKIYIRRAETFDFSYYMTHPSLHATSKLLVQLIPTSLGAIFRLIEHKNCISSFWHFHAKNSITQPINYCLTIPLF